MIFIIGISPKTKKLDRAPGRCSACGLHQAYHMRIDHYLNLFFIPVLRVKKGEAFMMCERCEKTIPESGPVFNEQPIAEAGICRYCGKSLEQEFRYCPFCGKRR